MELCLKGGYIIKWSYDIRYFMLMIKLVSLYTLYFCLSFICFIFALFKSLTYTNIFYNLFPSLTLPSSFSKSVILDIESILMFFNLVLFSGVFNRKKLSTKIEIMKRFWNHEKVLCCFYPEFFRFLCRKNSG